MQQDDDARPNRAGGKLQFAEIALREHDRTAGARLFGGGEQERGFAVFGDDSPGKVFVERGEGRGMQWREIR